MAREYLDKDGLQYFWQKVKTYIAQHGGGGLTVDDVYPVGSIYHTTDSSFDPNTTFGGTWSRGSTPYVIDENISGANNVWSYRKWSNGVLECWARFYTSSMNISTTTGQLKYGTFSMTNAQRTYPVEFLNYPTVTVSGDVTGGNGWVVMNNTDYSETKVGTMTAYSSASRTGVGVTVNILARGKWTNTITHKYEWTRTA